MGIRVRCIQSDNPIFTQISGILIFNTVRAKILRTLVTYQTNSLVKYIKKNSRTDGLNPIYGYTISYKIQNVQRSGIIPAGAREEPQIDETRDYVQFPFIDISVSFSFLIFVISCNSSRKNSRSRKRNKNTRLIKHHQVLLDWVKYMYIFMRNIGYSYNHN